MLRENLKGVCLTWWWEAACVGILMGMDCVERDLSLKPEVKGRVPQVVVGSRLDEIFMVMEYVEHDLKQLSESMKQPFSVAEVGSMGSVQWLGTSRKC